MGDEGPKTKPRTGGSTSPWMPSLRKRGEKILHSKYVVSLVIILTIVDCSLVIAELILDLYSVKKTLLSTEGQTFKFIKSIRTRYPDQVRPNDTVGSIYDRMAQSTIIWNNSDDLDLYINARDFNTNPTSTNTRGMSYLSMPAIFSERNNPEPIRDSYSQTVVVQNENEPTSYSPTRLKRSSKSNGPFGYSNHYEDNERRTRSNMDLTLNKLVRHVKRYLLTGRTNNSKHNFHDSHTTPDSIEDDGTFVDDYDDHNRNNGTILHLGNLVFLHKAISDILTMQLNGSKTPDFEYSTKSTAGDVDNDDGVDFRSTEFGIDANDTGMNVEINYSNGIFMDSSHESDQISDNSDRKDDEPRVRRAKRNSDDYEDNMRKELHRSEEMEIAHKLHYASLCVSSILVLEVTMKIVCAGSHFLKRKIQVFDAVVIVTSVVVDLIFIKGLPEFAVDDSIFVLALLLPWRVIRVVNSLVMAVIDHEQVKLRLLYSRKKKLDKTVESLRNEIDEIKGTLQEIRSFCIKEGIDSTRIDGMLGKFAPRRRKDSKFYTLVKLVMSTASINNNDNDSVSSSSIENDLRHYSNKDSVLNLAASSRGTMTSLKQYLSVPFNNGDSHSMSDIDSLAGDHPGLSPSIYITSPVSDDGRGILTFGDVGMDDNDVDMTCPESVACTDEGSNVATIAVTSNTTNINTMNGVSFFVGSQTSLNFGHSQENLMFLENDKSHMDSSRRSNFCGISVEATPSTTTDANRNFPSHQFGQFLTVPNGTEGVSIGSNSTILNFSSSNNNVSDDGDISNVPTSNTLLPQGLTKYEMKRSASDDDNITLRFSPYEGTFSHGSHGSPTPIRHLPEIRTKRKVYSRSWSESEDNEILGQTKRDRSGRSRRNSGDPQANSRRRTQDPRNARSHSPSPMTFLSVPGGNKNTCSSSRSMNDVSTVGNPYLNNSGDGIILRRSCLSLNTEGRKRRDKSPHKVSFKVS